MGKWVRIQNSIINSEEVEHITLSDVAFATDGKERLVVVRFRGGQVLLLEQETKEEAREVLNHLYRSLVSEE